MRLDGLELLVHPRALNDRGMVLHARVGGGHLLVATVRPITSAAIVSQLREGARALHEYLHQGRGHATTVSIPSLGTLEPGEMPLVEIASLLTEFEFRQKKWSDDAVRKQVQRAKKGLFAELRKVRLPGTRSGFDRLKVLALLGPQIQATKEQMDSFARTYQGIKAIKEAARGLGRNR